MEGADGGWTMRGASKVGGDVFLCPDKTKKEAAFLRQPLYLLAKRVIFSGSY